MAKLLKLGGEGVMVQLEEVIQVLFPKVSSGAGAKEVGQVNRRSGNTGELRDKEKA